MKQKERDNKVSLEAEDAMVIGIGIDAFCDELLLSPFRRSRRE